MKVKPTYLCIKQHSITGLLYFCKTAGSYEYMLKYKGSGIDWGNHLKIHGKEFVETPWFCLFEEKEELTKFALMCSEKWNIVEAKDVNGKKIWGNKIAENGLGGGGTKGIKLGPHSAEHTKNQSAAQKGKKQSAKTCANKSVAMIGKNKGRKLGPHSEEATVNQSNAQKGKKHPIVVCPVCQKSGGYRNMKRYHFDNCKQQNNE